MAEDATGNAPPGQESLTQVIPKNGAQTIREEVAEQIGSRSKECRTRVVNALVEEELGRRTTILMTALKKREDMMKDLAKTSRPKMAFHHATGEKIPLPLSQDEFNALKQKREQLAKLDKALDAALGEKADYTELIKQNSSGGGGGGENKGGGNEGEQAA